MHELQRTAILKPLITLKTCLFFGLCAVVLMGALASNALAQKPQLSPIIVSNSQNNENAINIARRLNPDFFDIDTENFGDGAVFTARYVDLDDKNPKRFIVLTVSNTDYYCTSYGCPFYFYENKSGNRWSLALSAQAFGFLHDKNTGGSTPNNLISQTREGGQQSIQVWLWNGQYYEKANR
jgi:hypothetical protein